MLGLNPRKRGGASVPAPPLPFSVALCIWFRVAAETPSPISQSPGEGRADGGVGPTHPTT